MHALQPVITVTTLFVGPFVLDRVLHRRAELWKEKLECAAASEPSEQWTVRFEMHVAEPPFQVVDDVECKGFWLKPDARTHEQRVKKLRTQVSSALIALLSEINRVRPRLVVGEGQGGVVVAMSTFPLIMERACRDWPVTPSQMKSFRQAWSGVTSILVVDPVILPTSSLGAIGERWA